VVQFQSTNQGSGAVWFDNVSLTTPTQTYGMTLPASRFGTGTQHILARAVDNTNDTSDLKSAQFEVFSSSPPPTIGSLDIDDDSVEIGSDITLTANDVADVDGIVEEVRFYRDSNHNNTLEVGTDQLIGASSQGTELVVNGDFESGTTNWTNMSTANHASYPFPNNQSLGNTFGVKFGNSQPASQTTAAQFQGSFLNCRDFGLGHPMLEYRLQAA